MTINDTLRNLQTETSLQQARDAEVRRAASVESRGASNAMGKHDFLMLLVAQLRHQNPMEPQNDNEFASQLANFAQLEQLENLNLSMQSMALQQSFGLVGNVVMLRDGEDVLTGIVEGIFVRDGEPQLVVNGYVFPMSAIITVLDSGEVVTPRVLVEVSNSLIGRNVKAEYFREVTSVNSDGETVTNQVLFRAEGVVTRVFVDDGQLFAHIDDGTTDGATVPVGAIFDIGKFAVTDSVTKLTEQIIIKQEIIKMGNTEKEEEEEYDKYGDYDKDADNVGNGDDGSNGNYGDYGNNDNSGNYGNYGDYDSYPPAGNYPPGYQYGTPPYSPYEPDSSYDEMS
jgi:flagellar basal-body rod modification protein FlgD